MTDTEQLKFKQKMALFPRSKVWDVTTQRNVDAIRAFLHRHPQTTISEIQSAGSRERPLKGSFHLMPAPAEDDIRQLLFRTINDLREVLYEPPTLVSVPVEWSISTAVSNKSYGLEQLRQDCKTDLTILYVHGGSFLCESTPFSLPSH